VTVNLFVAAAPESGWPLEVLEACHGRIAHPCAIRGKWGAHLPTHGAHTQVCQTADTIDRLRRAMITRRGVAFAAPS